MAAISVESFNNIINGKQVASPTTRNVINPATKKAIATVPVATQEQLDDAVNYAAQAQKNWAKVSQDDRGATVNKFADLLEANSETFQKLLTTEQGKPGPMAAWEVGGAVVWLREIAKQRLPTETLSDDADRKVITRHTPIGVCAGIVPWNFPVLLEVWKVAPALMAGNAIIIKPSPFTPLCGIKLVELFQHALQAHPGVLQVLSGDDRLGPWITSHPGIGKIAFTGSTATGKLVMKSASATLKRLTLELGGNDPAIVLKDVNPKVVAKELFWAAFQNNAQFCNATKRLFVHEDVYDAVLAAMVDEAKAAVVGDGADPKTTLGPIQNEMQYNKVKGYFADCVSSGLKFAVGGKIEDAAGYFVPVTLVDNPPDDSKIVKEEPFGPILPLLKWKDEAEVIRRANETPYGLGASVWGKDLEAVERIGAQLEAGTVWLNEIHQYSPHQVFGPHKESGIGAENGLAGLLGYTNTQTITLKKTPAF
ncbi:aldehyde dehydrogenase family protein [Meredithblackwellia eburnea MCA 4105]